MRSEHGNKPWITPSKHATHGDMAMEQKRRESIAATLLGLEEFLPIKKITQPIIAPAVHRT